MQRYLTFLNRKRKTDKTHHKDCVFNNSIDKNQLSYIHNIKMSHFTSYLIQIGLFGYWIDTALL